MLNFLRKAAPAIGIAAFFCVALFGEIWEASHSPHAPSQRGAAEQQSDAGNKADKKGNPNRNEIQSLWIPTDSIGLYTLVLSVFTGIMAISTIGLGILTFLQIRLARAEFISTHRPRISVHGLTLETSSDGKLVHVHFLYTNIGDSPAEITAVATSLMDMGKLPVTMEPNDIRWRYEKIEPPIEIASGVCRYHLTPDGLDVEKYIANSAWESTMLVCVGYITYRDKNGAVRQTGFCRRHGPRPYKGGHWSVLADNEYEYSY